MNYEEQYPKVFERAYVEHPPGWDHIVNLFLQTLDLWITVDDAKNRVNRLDFVNIFQTKEKFGELCIYFRIINAENCPFKNINEYVEGLADMAAVMSKTTCQTCGKPGTMRTHTGWWHVACDEHVRNRT